MADSIISVKNVNMTFTSKDGGKVIALKDINFDVKKNEFLVLIGPSGCGKSTLLGIIGGLSKATSGEVYLENERVTAPVPKRQSIMFQESAIFPWRTVTKNVEFGLEIAGIPAEKRKEIALREIQRVGLTGFENRYPNELSGGMKQRVAFARVLASDTDVILMDEPFGALDEQTRLILGSELARIWAETNKTIVFVTHSLLEAAFLGDRIILMSKRPGTIKLDINVDVPRPRQPNMPELEPIRARLWDSLAPEAFAMTR